VEGLFYELRPKRVPRSSEVSRYHAAVSRGNGVDAIGKEPEIVHVLGNVRIEQLERFVGVFATAGAEARGRHGNRGTQLFRVAGEEGRVVVLFEWESEEAFEAFRNDPSVKETMRSSGTVGPPEFTFLEKVGEFPS
jgi:heme-degrading monooxygenase HmoA